MECGIVRFYALWAGFGASETGPYLLLSAGLIEFKLVELIGIEPTTS